MSNTKFIKREDPQAIEKLQEKLNACQSLQEKMKSVNAYYKKYGTCTGHPELNENQAEKLDASVRNAYVNHLFLTNRYIYELLIKMCQESICTLETQEFERANDLIDCYHCLPIIIAENHLCIPKSYWKTYIRPYRDKWDKSFLVKEQKNYSNFVKTQNHLFRNM